MSSRRAVCRLSSSLRDKILDHPAVGMSEEDDFTVRLEIECGIVGVQAWLGTIHDETYAGKALSAARLYPVQHQQVTYAVGSSGVFKGHPAVLGKDGQTVEVEFARAALWLHGKHI